MTMLSVKSISITILFFFFLHKVNSESSNNNYHSPNRFRDEENIQKTRYNELMENPWKAKINHRTSDDNYWPRFEPYYLHLQKQREQQLDFLRKIYRHRHRHRHFEPDINFPDYYIKRGASGKFYTEISSQFVCCPKWMQITRTSYRCDKICTNPCQNNGECNHFGRCSCPKGYTGDRCEIDVDECATEKPCHQICVNLLGSFKCYCRVGYQLQNNGLSCRANYIDDGASEARDLSNEYHESELATRSETTTPTPSFFFHENKFNDSELIYDYQKILERLIRLEKQLARENEKDAQVNDLKTRIVSIVENIDRIKKAAESVFFINKEIHDIKAKMKLYDFESKKIQHISHRITKLENQMTNLQIHQKKK